MTKVMKNGIFCLHLAIVLLGNGFKDQTRLQNHETDPSLSFAGLTCPSQLFLGSANVESREKQHFLPLPSYCTA